MTIRKLGLVAAVLLAALAVLAAASPASAQDGSYSCSSTYHATGKHAGKTIVSLINPDGSPAGVGWREKGNTGGGWGLNHCSERANGLNADLGNPAVLATDIGLRADLPKPEKSKFRCVVSDYDVQLVYTGELPPNRAGNPDDTWEHARAPHDGVDGYLLPGYASYVRLNIVSNRWVERHRGLPRGSGLMGNDAADQALRECRERLRDLR